jgi:hypothetical protein
LVGGFDDERYKDKEVIRKATELDIQVVGLIDWIKYR